MFHRRFDRAETKEVRLYLHGGDDVVHITGQGGGPPLLRVIGGGGDDSVVDSSSGGRVRFYDARGANQVAGLHHAPLDDRPFADFQPSDSTPWPERDWGGFWRFRPWFSYGPDVGLFFGGGVVRYDFGFRKRPYRSRLSTPGRRYADRGRPVPGRAPGRFLSGQLPSAHVAAAPLLGHRA